MKKMIRVLLCTVLVGSSLIGCGSKNDTSDGGSVSSSKANAKGDINIEIVSKGFQHQYWQAVKKGVDRTALAVETDAKKKLKSLMKSRVNKQLYKEAFNFCRN